jgi:hypothetical protein
MVRSDDLHGANRHGEPISGADPRIFGAERRMILKMVRRREMMLATGGEVLERLVNPPRR